MIPAVSIDIEALNLASLVPMLIIIAGGLLIICIDLFKKDLHKSIYTILTILFIGIDLGAVLSYQGDVRGFFDVMLLDGISLISQIIILVSSALFILLALTSNRFHEYRYAEFFALFLFMIAGFQFMVSSDNLILIFVGLETASLSLYTLIAMHNREKSFEAAIKYFTMGALAAAFYVFGSMILYALTGSVELSVISQVLEARGYQPIAYVILAVVFMIGALGFKLSMVPSHTWTPDVYEGSSAALAGYMAIVPKIAGFVVAMRLFEFMVVSDVAFIKGILYVLVILTMTVANVIALVQKDVKRMLAYSSISHAGFGMAAILIATPQANSALFLYWTLFLFTNLGAFAMLWVNRHKTTAHTNGKFDHPFEKFSGMIKIMPVAASIMALFMIALAGLPPFSVFWGKVYMLSAAVNSGYIVLAVIMALNSALAGYYYLKLVVYMFLKSPEDNDGTIYMKNASMALKTIIGISALATIVAAGLVEPILSVITEYVNMSNLYYK
jgi:NADH-quinone oxidoreductase subunit N